MYSYLLIRRGYFHVRVRVPSDLSVVLSSAELVKSLKTKDKKTANQGALFIRQRITKTFSLFRFGILTGEQVRDSIDKILGRKPNDTAAIVAIPQSGNYTKVDSCDVVHFSSLVDQFVSDKHQSWGVKTKMENEASFRLLLDVIGDVDLRMVDRRSTRELRDKLSRLPANIYKRFPKHTAAQVLEIVDSDTTILPMSITSINKHLSRFSSLLSHCVKEGQLLFNPAEGINIQCLPVRSLHSSLRV
jgi:hypothetical protein